MDYLRVADGALRYEFRMQAHRRAVWLVVTALSALIFLLSLRQWSYLHRHPTLPQPDAVVYWAQMMTLFLPLAVGMLLADRLPRDRRLRVDEVLATLPGPLAARLAGKYVGGALATITPVALCYAAGIGYLMATGEGVHVLATAGAAFAAILLPGLLFVAAFSVACPVALKVPLYQFLLTGYWFWGNLMTPKIGLPSPTFTLFNAAGPWASAGFFHQPWFFFSPRATPGDAIANIALLLSLAALALGAAWGYLRWQQARA